MEMARNAALVAHTSEIIQFPSDKRVVMVDLNKQFDNPRRITTKLLEQNPINAGDFSALDMDKNQPEATIDSNPEGIF